MPAHLALCKLVYPARPSSHSSLVFNVDDLFLQCKVINIDVSI